ncbi:MAG: hypothetical protein WD426_06555 [Anditalea sp.]
MTIDDLADSKSFGGQRTRYFFVNFKNTFNEGFMAAGFRVISDMLEDIKSTRSIDDAFAQELEEASLLYDMLLVEIPIILERWKRTIEMKQKKVLKLHLVLLVKNKKSI